jgi:hypothetical protein
MLATLLPGSLPPALLALPGILLPGQWLPHRQELQPRSRVLRPGRVLLP